MNTLEKLNRLTAIVNHPNYHNNTSKKYRMKMIERMAMLTLNRLKEITQHNNENISK